MQRLTVRALIVGGVLAVSAAGAALARRPVVNADVRAHLRRGEAVADSLIEAARSPNEDVTLGTGPTLAVGYLERQRLGLGSPFRLIGYALADPRLDDTLRRNVAWALFDRTLAGRMAVVDAEAMRDIDRRPRPADSASDRRTSSRQLALIERTIREAADPRGGELTMRLAYAVAVAEGSASGDAFAAAAQAASLLRDRELARRDAVALIREAHRLRSDPLDLLVAWRADRRFAVERPGWTTVPADVEAAAIRAVAPTLVAIRAIHAPARGEAEPLPLLRALDAAVREPEPSYLGAPAARRFAELVELRTSPPQAAVVVPTRAFRSQLIGQATSRRERYALSRFALRVRNEETLAAEYALLRSRVRPGGASAAARVALAAAVALRPMAQEQVWFPRDGGPSVATLKRELGLATVSFDSDVPAAWRPYYLRMLQTAVADLRRVLPALSLKGAGVHFGESVMRDSVLALHDPRTRTIFLPLATSAGTIAHELAHDLDWQTARGLYRLRGDYSTDRAMRERHGRLAAAVSGLTASRPAAPSLAGSYRQPSSTRPAEVFARTLDWFVSAALAADGRADGYLSAVQDELLTGYAAVSPADVAEERLPALLDVLDDMTEVAPSARTVLDRFAAGRDRNAYDVVRDVLELPAPPLDDVPGQSLAFGVGFGVGRPSIASTPPAATSGSGCAPRDRAARTLARLRGELLQLAAEARARGVVRERVAGGVLGGARPWLAGDAPGSPWRAEPAQELISQVAAELVAGARDRQASRSLVASLRAGAGCPTD